MGRQPSAIRPLVALVAVVALVVGVAVGGGCERGGARAEEPVWGKQPCEHCAMLVDEARFAAQAATRDGTHVWFDDVGCLAAWLREHPGAATALWVDRDGAWVPAGAARFAGGERTPMGYGFVAAPSGIDWSELQRRLAARAQAEVTHAP